ncbi:hypothetical protein ILUMI_08410 [Ignelater luminosus]|uniref:NADH dehydrogenase [ubiquinone] 1 beta subcomplex subunit 3 n=1 Tax=Ignelater luminosus TaxID=2038154 RepID=A0A8K0GFG1_IGNLU|nr:hypothetical protein ILUMI_08410 [Ignelater luminosus]
MGGHDHHHEMKMPDYRIYKVEDIPQLVATKRALAARGLTDPWLRNEVWRFNPKAFGTEKSRIITTVFRGFRVGFVAFVLTVLGTAAYDKMNPPKHGHGHGHH